MRLIKSSINFCLLASVILLQACGDSSSSIEDTAISTVAGSYNNIIYVNGVARSYHLHIPPSFKNTPDPGLLLHLHGSLGNDITARERTGFDTISDQQGFIAVYPNAINTHWNDGRDPVSASVDDVGFIKALIQKLSVALNISAKRAYISGLSNGAIFAQRFACEAANEISAIAAVAGSLAIDTYTRCNPAESVSVLMFHGDDDPYVLWDGGLVPVFGGIVISVNDTINYWSDFNSCPVLPVITFEPDIDPLDGTTVTRTSYDGCNNQASVVLYGINGGGHTWPGSDSAPFTDAGNTSHDINASQIIWDFFESHAKQ